jgi:hypothetical protein
VMQHIRGTDTVRPSATWRCSPGRRRRAGEAFTRCSPRAMPRGADMGALPEFLRVTRVDDDRAESFEAWGREIPENRAFPIWRCSTTMEGKMKALVRGRPPSHSPISSGQSGIHQRVWSFRINS